MTFRLVAERLTYTMNTSDYPICVEKTILNRWLSVCCLISDLRIFTTIGTSALLLIYFFWHIAILFQSQSIFCIIDLVVNNAWLEILKKRFIPSKIVIYSYRRKELSIRRKERRELRNTDSSLYLMLMNL